MNKPVNCRCGGEAVIWHNFGGLSFVSCKECEITTRGYDNHQLAVEAWNRAIGERTAKVEEVEKPNVYKCGECGQYFHSTAWGSPVLYCSRCGAKLDWSWNE